MSFKRTLFNMFFNVPRELKRILNLMEKNGMHYPEGYKKALLQKYHRKGMKYPRILRRVGQPNIRKHFYYNEIFSHPARILDYGCGTGDDLRALIKDGFPKENLIGYDMDWDSINVGFDIYLDKDKLKNLFIASPSFPFTSSEFQMVYSGSVLHVLKNRDQVCQYLQNVFSVLSPGGIFFGSTLGRANVSSKLKSRFLFLLTREELTTLLNKIGFHDISIRILSDEKKDRFWFYAKKP